MNFLDKTFGRLGNRMFQTAALYTFAKDLGVDYYFQDEKYFKKYRENIIRLFSDGIGYDERIAIHVRRGDYVNNPFYVDLMATYYYEEAQKFFPSEKFLIFSDGIEFVKKGFIGEQYSFSEGKTEEEDLKLMASCKGHIIANSSFSWWGAYLSPHGGKVIYPKQWYADGIQRTKCPESWICV